MILSWNDHYPAPAVLKKEVTCMAEAFAEVLLEEIPPSEIEGVYLKGSALKDWESPLDYVPELSDVDLHLLFSDDSSIERHLGSVSQAMNIQSKVERRFFSKVTEPRHVPRPQLVVLNRLLRDEDYVPPPKSTVSVLYGKDSPEPDYSDPEKIRLSDCNSLLSQEEFLSGLPLQSIDRPSKYIWQALRLVSYRVSPAGPRVLHLLGVPTETAWSVNRTRAVSLLTEMGEDRMARDYADYYRFGWEFFLSGYSDGDAGRSALVAGAGALARGVEIAASWSSRRAK